MKTIQERFWAKVLKTETCWIWVGSRSAKGYGQISRTRKEGPIQAHRVALEWKLGRPIREGMFSLHHCDNPPCVRDEHLYEGTAAQNSEDMVTRERSTKGRPAVTVLRGEEASSTKLTEQEVLTIRQLYIPWQYGHRKLAKRFGVTDDTIAAIVSRRTWIHI